jgi:succinate dehydrogenase / fumarate reductase flavoprotein subunit
MTDDIRRYSYDVVVVGASGSGLRAAIEARLCGKKTAVISKSLFGKAHTVMAEGGCAAAMGNVNPRDHWQVHFRDTMRGGKFPNNPRMAELYAKEAPARVWELEAWGELFDRTKDGKISQRNFGGHEYPQLAHISDRTGLEMIRTVQQKVVTLQQEDSRESGDPEAMIKVFAETTITRLSDSPSARACVSSVLAGKSRNMYQRLAFEPRIALPRGPCAATRSRRASQSGKPRRPHMSRCLRGWSQRQW